MRQARAEHIALDVIAALVTWARTAMPIDALGSRSFPLMLTLAVSVTPGLVAADSNGEVHEVPLKSKRLPVAIARIADDADPGLPLLWRIALETKHDDLFAPALSAVVSAHDVAPGCEAALRENVAAGLLEHCAFGLLDLLFAAKDTQGDADQLLKVAQRAERYLAVVSEALKEFDAQSGCSKGHKPHGKAISGSLIRIKGVALFELCPDAQWCLQRSPQTRAMPVPPTVSPNQSHACASHGLPKLYLCFHIAALCAPSASHVVPAPWLAVSFPTWPPDGREDLAETSPPKSIDVPRNAPVGQFRRKIAEAVSLPPGQVGLLTGENRSHACPSSQTCLCSSSSHFPNLPRWSHIFPSARSCDCFFWGRPCPTTLRRSP